MKEAIKELFPPDVPPVMRWRLAMFGFCVLVIFHIIWACGWLEPLGIGGFAKAADLEKRVSAVERDTKDIKIQLIEQSIFDAKESECTATDERAKRFFSQRVIALSREYFSLSGQSIDIPPCRN